ncbi:hypothetical protein FJZ33_06345 [Candidatus Poribacteria bacterium]|nr:hypothetical protein [Candidatus Poribacteria bacterium]
MDLPRSNANITDNPPIWIAIHKQHNRKSIPDNGEINLLITITKAIHTGKGKIIVLNVSEKESYNFAIKRELSDVGKDISSGVSFD